MKTAKSNTLFVSRGFTPLCLILLFLGGISTAESAEFFSSKGKSVIIYHEEYRFYPDLAGYVVIDFRFGEEVLRDNAGGPSSTASNVYVRLRGESYDYEYFGNAPDLVVTFSSELLSNVIPKTARVQGSINVCAYSSPTDCVSISLNASVEAAGKPYRELRTSHTWSTEDLWGPDARTTEHFDGFESVALSEGTIAVSGRQNFTLDLLTPRTDSYLLSAINHTVTNERKGH